MFGNLTIDDILKANREGKEFFIPLGDVKSDKIQSGSASEFLKAARVRSIRHNPIAPNQADYVSWILWDRISFAASATIGQLFKLFVTPIGTNNKTKVDTNLEQVSVLPAPQWYNATGLSIYFNPNAAPIDLDNFLATEYLEFWVSQKVYAEGPLDCFPGSGGLVNHTALQTTPAAPEFVTNTTNGFPSVHNMFDLRLPAGVPLGKDGSGNNIMADGIIGVTVLQGQTFNVQFKADGGGASLAANNADPIPGVGLTINARISGILSRGVQ